MTEKIATLIIDPAQVKLTTADRLYAEKVLGDAVGKLLQMLEAHPRCDSGEEVVLKVSTSFSEPDELRRGVTREELEEQDDYDGRSFLCFAIEFRCIECF